jgi:hypothetical protein|eukprot:COSAG01_NODE_6947_length_3426_cov_13.114217_2_plen_46_part_00
MAITAQTKELMGVVALLQEVALRDSSSMVRGAAAQIVQLGLHTGE